MTQPMALKAHGLSKRYGRLPVLVDQSLAVARGEVVVVVGKNGVGKSTLLGCIAGTIIPDAGSVVIAGRDLSREPLAARRDLRFLPQECVIPDGLTGRELLELQAWSFGMRDGLDAAAVGCGLHQALDHLASTYSAGMRKRLTFAGLCLGEAALWVLDEPFGGLDDEGRERMQSELANARLAGAGLLVSGHRVDPWLSQMGARVVELGSDRPA